jgi:hypothetical protein
MTATPDEINRCFRHAPMTALYADEFFHFLGAKEAAAVGGGNGYPSRFRS